MAHVTHRPYTDADKQACLALFDSNCPQYFDPAEREDFIEFLDKERPALNGAYFVLELEGELVGCGGYNVSDKGVGKLCWGMVDQSRHKMGLGKSLLQIRLDGIKNQAHAKQVAIDTSQLSAPFFARFGFEKTGRTPDGYGPGIDHVTMELTL